MLGYQKILAAGGVQSLTVPTGATGAVIRCATAAGRYRFDTTNPTTSVGNIIAIGETITIYGTDALAKFECILTATGVLHVQYFKQNSERGNLRKYMTYEQVAVVSASIGITPPATATGAIIRAETQGVSYRFDGVPTATDGNLVAAGTDLIIHGRTNLVNVKFIEQAASAKLNVQYFRQ
jgi:hypothetical protein